MVWCRDEKELWLVGGDAAKFLPHRSFFYALNLREIGKNAVLNLREIGKNAVLNLREIGFIYIFAHVINELAYGEASV